MIEKKFCLEKSLSLWRAKSWIEGSVSKLGGNNHKVNSLKPLMWLLNSADGHRDLFHIATLSGIAFSNWLMGPSG